MPTNTSAYPVTINNVNNMSQSRLQWRTAICYDNDINVQIKYKLAMGQMFVTLSL